MTTLIVSDTKPNKPYLRWDKDLKLKYGADCNDILANADFSKTESRNNGFFWSLYDAYKDHHNLHLRPDDVWLQIISQFSRYCSHHKLIPRNPITIIKPASDNTITSEVLLSQVGCHLDEWVKTLTIPKFSTTTDMDRLVSQLMISCNMDEYYGRFVQMKCGLPAVTLYGTVDDWQHIIDLTVDLSKYDQSDHYIQKWLSYLIPVLENFLHTIQGDSSDEIKTWWNSVCHNEPGASDTSYVSGWITVFCMMDQDNTGFIFNDITSRGLVVSRWPIIDTNKIPTAFVCTPITIVKARGGASSPSRDFVTGVERISAKIFAGLMGSSYVSTDSFGIKPEVLWVITKLTPCDSAINELLDLHPLNLVKIADRCNICQKTFKETFSCLACDYHVCISCVEICHHLNIAEHEHTIHLTRVPAICTWCSNKVSVGYSCESCDIFYCFNCVSGCKWSHMNQAPVDTASKVTLQICDVRRKVPNLNDRSIKDLKLGLDFNKIFLSSDISDVKWNNNGFVNACCTAYNEHHDLNLRPDDVWLAVLSQFGSYVNSFPELLRAKFVTFRDKVQLVVKHYNINIGKTSTACPTGDLKVLGKMANDFLEQINNYLPENVKSITRPTFSTTTPNDRLVADLMMLCIMKKYFGLRYETLCGLPSVNLYGTVADWEKVLELTKQLRQFNIDLDIFTISDEGYKIREEYRGNDGVCEELYKYMDINGDSENSIVDKWIDLLVPILENFIRTAKGENSRELKNWWNQICHVKSASSGPDYLSGWITVFCMMQENDQGCSEGFTFQNTKTRGNLTSIWPIIDTDDIPTGFLSAPLTMVIDEQEFPTKIYAGMMGMSLVEHNKYGIKPTPMWVIANIHHADPVVNELVHKHPLSVMDVDKGYFSSHKCDICRKAIKVSLRCPACDFDLCFTCNETLHALNIREHEHQLQIMKELDACTTCETISHHYKCEVCDIKYCFTCINKCNWADKENRVNKIN